MTWAVVGAAIVFGAAVVRRLRQTRPTKRTAITGSEDIGDLALDAVLSTRHRLHGVQHVHPHVWIQVVPLIGERLTDPDELERFRRTLQRRVVLALARGAVHDRQRFRPPVLTVQVHIGTTMKATAHGNAGRTTATRLDEPRSDLGEW